MPKTVERQGHSNAWEPVILVVMQGELCKLPERWPCTDFERSTFQGLDFVGRINASVKREIQVRLVENWSTLVLGSKGGVRVTDGLAIHGYLLEKPRQRVLPVRGDRLSFSVGGRERSTQPGLYFEGRSHPSSRRGESTF